MVRLFYAFAHLRNPDWWVTAAPPLQHLLGPPVYSQILGRHSGTVFGRRVLPTSRGWMSLFSPPYIGFQTARSNFLFRMQTRRGAELPSNILRSAPLPFYHRDCWMRGTILISVIVGCQPLSIDEQRLDCLCVSKIARLIQRGGGGVPPFARCVSEEAWRNRIAVSDCFLTLLIREHRDSWRKGFDYCKPTSCALVGHWNYILISFLSLTTVRRDSSSVTLGKKKCRYRKPFQLFSSHSNCLFFPVCLHFRCGTGN